MLIIDCGVAITTFDYLLLVRVTYGMWFVIGCYCACLYVLLGYLCHLVVCLLCLRLAY